MQNLIFWSRRTDCGGSLKLIITKYLIVSSKHISSFPYFEYWSELGWTLFRSSCILNDSFIPSIEKIFSCSRTLLVYSCLCKKNFQLFKSDKLWFCCLYYFLLFGLIIRLPIIWIRSVFTYYHIQPSYAHIEIFYNFNRKLNSYHYNEKGYKYIIFTIIH